MPRRDPAREEEKVCARCGRRISYRKKWASTWGQIRFCSDACRAHRLTAVDHQLEQAIRALLTSSRGTTVCPSDAARAVGGATWPDLAERARQAARRLVAAGEIVMMQGGHVVDPSTAKGAVRLRNR